MCENPTEYLAAARERRNAFADRLAKVAGFEGELRPGAVVRLKSGSPPMTIALVDITDGLVYCHWFFRGRTGQARYSPEMLERCAPSTPESFVPPTQAGPNTYDLASGLRKPRAGRQSLQKASASESE